MARIRTIKPDFFKNEGMAELPAMVRLLFIGLWTQSDREGRLEDRPKRLKAELFPYDNFDVDKSLTELQNGGFILRYKSDVKVSDPEQPTKEVAFIQIVNFKKHQQPNVKEQPSTIPAPYKNGTSITGKEGKGTGKEQEGERGTRTDEEKKIVEEVLNSQKWIEETAMHLKQSLQYVEEKLKTFLTELKLKDGLLKGVSEVRSHFINWLKIEIEKEKIPPKNFTNGKPESKLDSIQESADYVLKQRGIDPTNYLRPLGD